METRTRYEAEHTLAHGMTVGQLIEQLQDLDLQSAIVFTTSYGDYGQTEQALRPQEIGQVHMSRIEDNSGYSRSGLAVRKTDELERDRQDARDEVADLLYDLNGRQSWGKAETAATELLTDFRDMTDGERECLTTPDQTAEELLESVRRRQSGEHDDNMTVAVVTLDGSSLDWSDLDD